MSTPFPTVGLIAKRGDARADATLRQVVTYLHTLRSRGCLEKLLLAEENTLDVGADVARVARDALAQQAKLVIVIGGDGTLLSAARSLAPSGVPLLGINQGRLGFLVEVPPTALETALDAVFAGEYSLDERPILAACVRRAAGDVSPTLLAVNDVVIRNLASIRMLEFETWLDDEHGQWEFISRHRADGLIVATPTGSTAYAMSGGGPIVHPQLSALSLVPICPHTLTDRPIVVPAARRIRITAVGGSGANMTCDGQVGRALNTGDAVEISPSLHRLRLVHVRGYSYFGVLRDKLLWGRSSDSGRTDA